MMNFKLFFLFVLSFWMSFVLAQNKDLKKELNEVNVLVYNNPDLAISKAKELEKRIDKNDIETLQNVQLIIGSAYSTKENHQEALKYGFKAYEMVKNSSEHANKIKALGFIANQYYILQLDDKVNFYLDQSEKIISKNQIKDSLKYLIANVYLLRAVNYKDKLDCNFAIDYFNKSSKAYQQAKYSNSKFNLPVIYIQKGYCFYDLGNIDSAAYNFKKAYEISEKNDIKYSKLYSMVGISKILQKEKKYPAALDTLLKAKQQIDHQTPLKLQTETYRSFVDNYYDVNDYTNYLLASEQYKKLLKEEFHINLQSVENILQTQEKSMNENYENHRKNQFIIYFLAIFGLLSFIVFLIFKLRQQNI